MQNLKRLRYDALGDYDAITMAKYAPRRQILEDARSDVSDRFDIYAANAHTLELVTDSTFVAPTDEALRHCYLVVTAPLSSIKARIRAAQTSQWQNLCPYCGIDSSSTFDHYLCKEKFPEFSMHHSNIVPSCGVCNGLKGTREIEGGQRQFINFYYDELPALIRWLHCRIDVAGGVPTAVFWFDCPVSVPAGLRTVLASHYEKLELSERFRRKAAQVLSETLALARRSTADDYATSFALQATRWGELYGANYWECALLEAMAASDDFLALLAM